MPISDEDAASIYKGIAASFQACDKALSSFKHAKKSPYFLWIQNITINLHEWPADRISIGNIILFCEEAVSHHDDIASQGGIKLYHLLRSKHGTFERVQAQEIDFCTGYNDEWTPYAKTPGEGSFAPDRLLIVEGENSGVSATTTARMEDMNPESNIVRMNKCRESNKANGVAARVIPMCALNLKRSLSPISRDDCSIWGWMSNFGNGNKNPTSAAREPSKADVSGSCSSATRLTVAPTPRQAAITSFLWNLSRSGRRLYPTFSPLRWDWAHKISIFLKIPRAEPCAMNQPNKKIESDRSSVQEPSRQFRQEEQVGLRAIILHRPQNFRLWILWFLCRWDRWCRPQVRQSRPVLQAIKHPPVLKRQTSLSLEPQIVQTAKGTDIPLLWWCSREKVGLRQSEFYWYAIHLPYQR